MSEPPEKVDVSSLKDTFLECPVCVEHFNQTDRRPRLLHSCLHAFCTQCLQQLLDKEGNGEITCPLCRRIEKVSGTAQMMAIDPVRDQLVEYLHIQKKKQVLCKDCPDGNNARSRCFGCGENLCLDCENAHRRNRSTRGHEIKLLDELQAASCESLKVRIFCCNHPDRLIECFCLTCEALCCVMCAIIEHKGHEFQKLDDAAANIIRETEGSMVDVQSIFKNLSNAKSESEEYVTIVQEDRERSISEINQKFDALSKRLKHRKETLLKIIEDDSERFIAAANTNRTAFGEGLAEIESTMNYFTNVKTKADCVNVLQIQSSLRKKIDHLTHRYGGKEIPKNTERCHFEAQHEENIHQGIDEFGVVRRRGAEVARRVAEKEEHKCSSHTLVSLYDPVESPSSELDTNTIAVTGFPSTMTQDTLVMYFENKRHSCGGYVLEASFSKKKDVLYIKFEMQGVADQVLEKREHTVEGVTLTIVKAGIEEPATTIEIRGYEKAASNDYIEMYFESMRKSGAGPTIDLKRNDKKGVIYITFETEEGRRRDERWTGRPSDRHFL
ncbi:E3 ubiquitin-protein ligase TRIM45-like [Haliotis cracherodii]|uniref:E3 ubiquitin-protein ligase TRIM45-like n=1 Tax=Haliotis cracherodii TaxID=6455 RepID=UPI0039EC76C5